MSGTPPGSLHDPQTLRALLARHGLRAEKGLGQHFLVSGPVVDEIVGAVAGCRGVLEIGPGPGVLTQRLSTVVERTIALEVDPRMARVLGETAPAAEVRLGDALRVDLAAAVDELPRPAAIVSNMPYYITGPLLQRMNEVRLQIGRAVLMMQREVAGRVVAPAGSGERGSLSVFLQAGFAIERLIDVPASAFLPPPKVDSTVLVFTPRPDAFDPAFFRLVRAGFTQPRKTLANNLSASLRRPREELLDIFSSLALPDTVRAQELTEAQWVALEHALR